MAQSLSKERLDQVFLKEISRIIEKDVKDPHVGFVTITGIKISPDLSYATVYVSFLGKKERNNAGVRALNRAASYIRKELSRSVKVRKVPQLNFRIDESVAKANRIDQLLAIVGQELRESEARDAQFENEEFEQEEME